MAVTESQLKAVLAQIASDIKQKINITDIDKCISDYLKSQSDTAVDLKTAVIEIINNNLETIDLDKAVQESVSKNLNGVELTSLVGHAKEDVEAMTMGWNIGNTFESMITLNEGDKESLTRFNTDKEAPYYETCWGAHTTTAAMFDLLKESGFNAVRMPITWAQHIGITVDENGNKTYTLSPKWVARLKEVVQMILDRDMYCIINTHHDDANYAEKIGQDVLLLTGWLDCNPERYDEVSKLFAMVWGFIANEFKDYGDKLIFESFNELQTSKRNWKAATLDEYRTLNDLQQVFIDVVRASGGNNATRTLCCQTHMAALGQEDMIEPPVDVIENGIIWQIHDYTKELDTFKAKSEYQYFVDHDMPLIVGEWGTYKDADGCLPQALRVIQAQNFMATRTAMGFKCFWWDDDGNFELMDRANATWYDYAEPILAAMREGLKGNTVTIDYKMDTHKNTYADYQYGALNDKGAYYKTNDRDGLVPKDYIDVKGCDYFGLVLDKSIGYCITRIALYDDDGNCLKTKKGRESGSLLMEVGEATKAKFYVNNPWGYRSAANYKEDLANGNLSIKIQAF